mmetsp:Transcript_18210/g.19751  ORF Transcript_18210/g.19751 Transcript_18210/m.19751 type:complete len:109 (-) Transcript_18210:30-356(-)
MAKEESNQSIAHHTITLKTSKQLYYTDNIMISPSYPTRGLSNIDLSILVSINTKGSHVIVIDHYIDPFPFLQPATIYNQKENKNNQRSTRNNCNNSDKIKGSALRIIR